MSEEKIVIKGDVEAGEESRVRLSGPCEVNEYDVVTYEIVIPEIVLVELGVEWSCSNNGVKSRIQFVKENGRVYVEKAKE